MTAGLIILAAVCLAVWAHGFVLLQFLQLDRDLHDHVAGEGRGDGDEEQPAEGGVKIIGEAPGRRLRPE